MVNEIIENVAIEYIKIQDDKKGQALKGGC